MVCAVAQVDAQGLRDVTTARGAEALRAKTLSVPYVSGVRPISRRKLSHALAARSALSSGNQGSPFRFSTEPLICFASSCIAILAVERIHECEALTAMYK